LKTAGLRRSAAALCGGAIIGYLLVTFGAALLRVSGSSMEPTLHAGAVVLVLRPGPNALLRGSSVPRRGDVVVLAVPGNGARVVKRVVATAGQTVAMLDGAVLVDGVLEAAVAVSDRYSGHFSFPVLKVPDGHVFVVGDNRLPLSSRDSRDFGPVSIAALRGRVIAPRTGL